MSDAKQRILDAAFEEFALKGFSGGRMQSIADRAGINKAMLNYYFTGKRQLYLDVVKDKLTEVSSLMEQALSNIGSAREYISAFIKTHNRILAGNPQLVRLILHNYLTSELDMVDIFNKLEFSEKLFKRIKEFIARGEIRVSDPREVIIHLMSMNLQTHLMQTRYEKQFKSIQKESYTDRRVDSIIDLFENGLFAVEDKVKNDC